MTLTEDDIEAVISYIVSDWKLERLDSSLGTKDAVAWLQSLGVRMGSVSGCDDLPYPEWARWIDVDTRGAHVRVEHHQEVVREGRVSWSLIANRAIIAACQLRGVEADGQAALF